MISLWFIELLLENPSFVGKNWKFKLNNIVKATATHSRQNCHLHTPVRITAVTLENDTFQLKSSHVTGEKWEDRLYGLFMAWKTSHTDLVGVKFHRDTIEIVSLDRREMRGPTVSKGMFCNYFASFLPYPCYIFAWSVVYMVKPRFNNTQWPGLFFLMGIFCWMYFYFLSIEFFVKYSNDHTQSVGLENDRMSLSGW